MSHFSRIKTKITKLEFLLHALDDLGYSYQVGSLFIDGFDKKRKVDVKINLENSYSIGFKSMGDYYVLTADWWGVRGIHKDEFLNSVLQRYAYHTVRSKLEIQGFDLVGEEKSSSGEIRLTLRRML
jgi:hypothetical protein